MRNVDLPHSMGYICFDLYSVLLISIGSLYNHHQLRPGLLFIGKSHYPGLNLGNLGQSLVSKPLFLFSFPVSMVVNPFFL